MKDRILVYAFIFNIIMMIMFAISVIFDLPKDVYDIFNAGWMLSFGWLCGRMSR